MTGTRYLLPAIMVLTLACTLVASPAGDPVTVSAGDYSASFGESGVAVTHQGVAITTGSYLNVFKPKYEGSLITFATAWRQGQVTVSDDGRTATLAADLPDGRLVYTLEVSPDSVRVTAAVTLVEDAQIGPVEYAIFHIPADLIAGGRIEMWNSSGAIADSKPIPAESQNGALAGAQEGLTIQTPERKITVHAESYGTLYPFDGRHERYGVKYGVWPFAGMPLIAGDKTVAVHELKVLPPDPVREPGTITIFPETPAAAVVTAPDPTARESFAATELVGYLERMTGKRLDLSQAAADSIPAGAIVVGPLAVEAGLIAQAELDEVQRDGYVVKVSGGKVAISGWRDLGTIYGAYALLRNLGCEFYAPACETVPEIPDLTIEECRLADKPFYEFRNVNRNLKLGQTPSNDMMDPGEIGEPGNIVHSASYLLPFEKYEDEHPEYFALQKDGKRLHRDPENNRFDVHLCLSNPDVRRISAERMIALIDKQSDRTFFGVSQGDGFAWCECDQCKALDAVPGKVMTDRLLDYVNYIAREVAKKYPDKRILTLAYTNATSPPPTRVMPEPNVMVQYCPYPPRTGCHSHDFTCPKNTQGIEDLTGWIEKCPDNMYIFDYPTGYENWYEPFGSFYAMKGKLDFYAANGVRGLFYCGTPKAFQNLFIYVQSKLLWHPETEIEPLIDEFMAAYYGAAAPYVRAYFDYMYSEVEQRPIHQMCEAASPHTVTPEFASKGLAWLGQAEQAVTGDLPSLHRVRAEKLCVLFGDINPRNPFADNLAISEDEFAKRLAQFLEIGRDMRIGEFIRRKPADEWLYQIARVRLQRSPWYADPVVSRIVADPPGALAALQQRYAQAEIDGGWRLELDGFRGCKGPEEYSYDCAPRRAVWIYGTDSATPRMSAVLNLDKAPTGPARLVATAQDDDKQGAVRVSISVNGTSIFEGSNPFPENGWSSAEFAIPAGVLRQGENVIEFATLDKSAATDAGWFMLAECLVMAP